MRAVGNVVRGRPGGEERNPRFGGLGDICLGQACGIFAERFGVCRSAVDHRLPPLVRQEFGGGQDRDLLEPAT